ncbi:MAG: carboxyltransferase domain-containing protein [Candidatus Dormibacteria bacterium]
MESPGGWRVIGRTQVALYDPERSSPVLLRPGDQVRFEVVSGSSGWSGI